MGGQAVCVHVDTSAWAPGDLDGTAGQPPAVLCRLSSFIPGEAAWCHLTKGLLWWAQLCVSEASWPMEKQLRLGRASGDPG